MTYKEKVSRHTRWQEDENTKESRRISEGEEKTHDGEWIQLIRSCGSVATHPRDWGTSFLSLSHLFWSKLDPRLERAVT
jgi:hypothetical protein